MKESIPYHQNDDVNAEVMLRNEPDTWAEDDLAARVLDNSITTGGSGDGSGSGVCHD
jgi:hypothetical protein